MNEAKNWREKKNKRRAGREGKGKGPQGMFSLNFLGNEISPPSLPLSPPWGNVITRVTYIIIIKFEEMIWPFEAKEANWGLEVNAENCDGKRTESSENQKIKRNNRK